MGIQIAKAMGLNVIGIDVNDDALKAARENGADVVVNNLAPDYESKVKEVSAGGVHAAVVFSAAHAAFNSSIKILRIAGILMVIGLPAKPLEFAAFDLMRKVYRVRSEATGPPQNMPRAVDFISKHNIKPKVATYKLEQIHEMIDLMRTGKSTSRMAVVF
jgi:propanol-preferring alcohol dehydrogenase